MRNSRAAPEELSDIINSETRAKTTITTYRLRWEEEKRSFTLFTKKTTNPIRVQKNRNKTLPIILRSNRSNGKDLHKTDMNYVWMLRVPSSCSHLISKTVSRNLPQKYEISILNEKKLILANLFSKVTWVVLKGKKSKLQSWKRNQQLDMNLYRN